MTKIIQNHTYEFVDIPEGTYELGWRFDQLLPQEVLQMLEQYTQPKDFRAFYFSPKRIVNLNSFKIATTTITWEDLVDWNVEPFYEQANTIVAFCDLLNAYLKQFGCRLPTEDEFEVACGGALFPWGTEIPEGLPLRKYTTFRKHELPSAFGLHLDPDSYKQELVYGKLKYGDGGEAVCGGYTWPVPWLSYCPAYRVVDVLLQEAFWEFLEDAQVRVVVIN